MSNELKTVAYIIGNAFETLTQLPNVYTVNQFFSAIFENCLPDHRLWIIGQGIHASVREILSLCEESRPELNLHFGSLAVNTNESWSQLDELLIQSQENVKKKYQIEPLEWHNFQFVDANRVKADLKLTYLSDEDLLANNFLFTATRELCEKACRQSLPNGKLLIKTAQLHSFHRCFPLPITVETKFQLSNDNKRSLKSLTRFYQDYSCVAEVHLLFDLFTEEETKKLLHALGEKTFGHFSDKINELE